MDKQSLRKNKFEITNLRLQLHLPGATDLNGIVTQN